MESVSIAMSIITIFIILSIFTVSVHKKGGTIMEINKETDCKAKAFCKEEGISKSDLVRQKRQTEVITPVRI